MNKDLQPNKTLKSNYGRFWYLNPKTWNDVDKKYKNQTVDGLRYENMASNPVLVKLLQGSNKTLVKEDKPQIQPNSEDEVQKFEKDLMQTLENRASQSGQFLQISQSLTQNMIRRRSRIVESQKIDVP